MTAAIVFRVGRWMRVTSPWTLLLVCCASVLFLGALTSFGTAVAWVGYTNLQAEFVVLDAETGRPVPAATIDFRTEGGGFCCEDGEKNRYSMESDSSGRLLRTWTQCMCFGTKSLWKDSFFVHLPWLWFQASAPGYVASEWTYLDNRPYIREVKRGNGCATLTVVIRIRKEMHRLTSSPHSTAGAEFTITEAGARRIR